MSIFKSPEEFARTKNTGIRAGISNADKEHLQRYANESPEDRRQRRINEDIQRVRDYRAELEIAKEAGNSDEAFEASEEIHKTELRLLDRNFDEPEDSDPNKLQQVGQAVLGLFGK